MKRLVPTIKIGTVVGMIALCAAPTFSAPPPGTPRPAPQGKEQYSSRPKNYTPPTMLGSMFETQAPQEMVEVDGPVAATPMPAPTLRSEAPRLATPTWTTVPAADAAEANQSIRAPKEVKNEPIIITEQSEKRAISSVEVGVPAAKPKAVPQPVEEAPKSDDGAAVLNFAPRQSGTKTESIVEEKSEVPAGAQMVRPLVEPLQKKPVAVVETVNELDEFNARLAKIQLEKHNLAETLALIEKIKSPNFQVKTLVDLAEYVSRDSNYKREAETLYTLAVNGIDALADGKPVVVTMPTKVTTPTKPAPPKKAAPTLVEEAPKPTPTLVAPPKPAAEPVVPQVTRTPTLLDEPVKSEEVKKEAPKTTLPTLAPQVTPPAEVKPVAPAAPATSESSRRPSILMTEEPKAEAPKVEEKKAEPVAVPAPTMEKKEEEPAAAPKSTRRPMPGKRTVTLEAN